MKLYEVEKLIAASIAAVIELQQELEESSKACWEDDFKSLRQRITELAKLEGKLADTLFAIRTERETKACRHGRAIKSNECGPDQCALTDAEVAARMQRQ